MSDKTGGLGLRLVTLAIAGPAIVVLAVHPQLRLGFDTVAALLLALGTYECAKITKARSIDVDPVWLTVVGFGIIVAAHFGFLNPGLFTGIVLITCIQLLKNPPKIAEITASVFCLVYVSWLGGHIVMLRQVPTYGPGLMIMLFAIIWTSDTGAYLIGVGFGKHRLSPRISPKKTIEGAVAGVVCGTIAMALTKQVELRGTPILPPLCYVEYLILGVVMSVVGQAGDLLESSLKRDVGIKDAGSLFPGHGGFPTGSWSRETQHWFPFRSSFPEGTPLYQLGSTVARLFVISIRD